MNTKEFMQEQLKKQQDALININNAISKYYKEFMELTNKQPTRWSLKRVEDLIQHLDMIKFFLKGKEKTINEIKEFKKGIKEY